MAALHARRPLGGRPRSGGDAPLQHRDACKYGIWVCETNNAASLSIKRQAANGGTVGTGCPAAHPAARFAAPRLPWHQPSARQRSAPPLEAAYHHSRCARIPRNQAAAWSSLSAHLAWRRSTQHRRNASRQAQRQRLLASQQASSQSPWLCCFAHPASVSSSAVACAANATSASVTVTQPAASSS